MGGGAVDAQHDLVADADAAVALVLGGDRLAVAEAGVEQGALAQPLDQLDGGRGAFGGDANAFRPHAKLDSAFRQPRARNAGGDLRAIAEPHRGELPALDQGRRRQRHRRRAHEPRDEGVGRPSIDLHRRADLLDPAVVHHHHSVGEGHRLRLVVGDHDHRRIDPLAQLGELHAGAHAQRRVEVRQRLVEEEQPGLFDQGPPDGDALALAARHLSRLLVELRLDLQDPRRLLDPRGDLVLRHLRVAEAEGHVLAHAHVRIKRVMLEDHRDAAPARRQGVDPLALQPHLAAVGGLEPGDDAQQGRFAAARRAEKGDELLRLHGERHAVQDRGRAEGLADVDQLEACQTHLP